jgi:hypothetical protein
MLDNDASKREEVKGELDSEMLCVDCSDGKQRCVQAMLETAAACKRCWKQLLRASDAGNSCCVQAMLETAAACKHDDSMHPFLTTP